MRMASPAAPLDAATTGAVGAAGASAPRTLLNHCSFGAVPTHRYWTIAALLAVDALDTLRHLPECSATSVNRFESGSWKGFHCSLSAEPVQRYWTTGALSAVDAPETLRHLPLCSATSW